MAAITPTVLGAATVDGRPVLVVVAGEHSGKLKTINEPLSEYSPEAYAAAFQSACDQLGYGEKQDNSPSSEEQIQSASDDDSEDLEEEAQGSGSERWGASDWTAMGMDKDNFPVPKGSPEDITTAKTDDEKE